MKVTETHEFYSSDHDGETNVKVSIITDSKEALSVSIGEGESEDMYLFRDLSDAYLIADLVKIAYNAGKNGEDFIYELIEDKD